MKKLRITLNHPGGVYLLSALAAAAVGTLLLVFGNKAFYVPMCMAAWLHFGVAALLALCAVWPMLISFAGKAGNGQPSPTEGEQAAQQQDSTDAQQQDSTDAEQAPKKKRKRQALFSSLWKRLKLGFWKWLARHGNLIGFIVMLVCFGVCGFFFIRTARPDAAYAPRMSYLLVFWQAIAFLVLLIVGKALKHFAPDARQRASLSSVFDVLRLQMLLLIIGTVISVTGLVDATPVMRIVEYVVGAYCALFLVLSLINALIRGTCATGVLLTLPRLFSSKSDGEAEEDLLDYLERSTGITLRSLFGFKVARRILPAVALAVVFCFWLSTGVTTVETHQKGVLYRFGDCNSILEPGLHITMPYPFDKVEVYETETVREMVVGYESEDRTNLLWSESHGGTEYKLLLGDGAELVSVNLRIQYKIDDLREYVTCSAEPESILNAKAYSVITDITVHTTLDQILAEDRAALSKNIEDQLGAYLDNASCGLAVCDVIIESIHPPVEVAGIYQQVVSAQLTSAALVDTSEGLAAANRAFAELKKNASIMKAEIRQNERVSEAEASVAEFMAMVEAYETHPDSFCYYKYLNALAVVYQNQRLYILGDGIDEQYLYFGNGVIIYNNGQ